MSLEVTWCRLLVIATATTWCDHSSFTNLPVPSLIAAKNVRKMKTSRRGSAYVTGMPVSRPNYARGPLPVKVSPMREAAKPN